MARQLSIPRTPAHGEPLAAPAAALTASLRQWLASGRCQSASGAFYAWHDATTGQPAYEYPEITGYALTHFARHPDLSAEEADAARRAAEWLVGRLEAGDLSARAHWDGGAAYTFDLAMIATGLMTFGARVGRDRYVAQGLALARALREQLHSDSGLDALHPDARGQRVASARAAGWSTAGQAHLLKVAQCLLLADALGQAGALDSAVLLVRQRLGWQREDGRFVTQPEEALTMLHPHLYALEGLWMWGQARQDRETLARARAGLDWTWARQLPSGGFPRSVRVSGPDDPSERIEQTDVTCQAIRLTLALGMEPPGLPAALARLGELAVEDGAGAALLYQPSSPQRHLNAWVSLFGAQASEIAAFGAETITWQSLV